MTAPSIDEVDRVYRYLVDYITTKKYSPSGREIIEAMGWNTTKLGFGERWYRANAALAALEQAGKIRVLKTSGRSDIRLTSLPAQPTPSIATATTGTPPPAIPVRVTPGPIICIE